MEYIGIFPQSMFNQKNVEKVFHHSEKVNGKIVNYYEVVKIEETKIYIPLNKSRIMEISSWDFQA
jgi:hypothetical protein